MSSGYIDNYGSDQNPVVDITGTNLKVSLNFADKGATSPTDHALTQFAALLGFPPSLSTLLNTPLSQMCDQIWAQNPGPDGKTIRDTILQQIPQQVSTAVGQIGPGFSAYNISASAPTTGRLFAIVLSGALTNPLAGQIVLLSYQLSGLTADFTASTPFTGGILADPKYHLSFDVELLMLIVIPKAPSPLTSTASMNIENADISASNLIAAVGDAVFTAISLFTGRPTRIFQGAEGEIDRSTNATGALNQLDSILTLLGSNWPVASGTYGFTQLNAFIDGGRSLNLQFVHAMDPAPVLADGSADSGPSLFHPVLATSASIVQAGDSVVVIGSFFPVAQASRLVVVWNDTVSGHVTQSDISWGPTPGPIITSTKTRSAFDNQNFFVADNLIPGNSYVFSVRDEDALTETPFSVPLTLQTQASDLLQLVIAPQGGGASRPLGTATLTATGVFSATVTIPADLATGTYIISAVKDGTPLASTGIKVVAAGQQVPATIQAIDPATNTVITGLTEGQAVTFRGVGFRAGSLSITIDVPGGTGLATADADASGAFQVSCTWPIDVTGSHRAVAEQTVGGPTLDASVDLFIQKIPR